MMGLCIGAIMQRTWTSFAKPTTWASSYDGRGLPARPRFARRHFRGTSFLPFAPTLAGFWGYMPISHQNVRFCSLQGQGIELPLWNAMMTLSLSNWKSTLRDELRNPTSKYGLAVVLTGVFDGIWMASKEIQGR